MINLTIDQYESILNKKYQKEMLHLYEKANRAYMESNAGRTAYQTCCKYLKKMVKLGGKQQAKILAEEWKNKYPRRPALQQELSKLKL